MPTTINRRVMKSAPRPTERLVLVGSELPDYDFARYGSLGVAPSSDVIDILASEGGMQPKAARSAWSSLAFLSNSARREQARQQELAHNQPYLTEVRSLEEALKNGQLPAGETAASLAERIQAAKGSIQTRYQASYVKMGHKLLGPPGAKPFMFTSVSLLAPGEEPQPIAFNNLLPKPEVMELHFDPLYEIAKGGLYRAFDYVRGGTPITTEGAELVNGIIAAKVQERVSIGSVSAERQA